VAFTRLFGYVRYFHPSDEAASTDWDRFAIDGVRAVEAAATPQELASTLGKLFRPVAPTVRVFAGGKPVALPSEQAKPASSTARLTLWKHTGVGLGQKQPQIYSSVREVRDAVGPEADPAQPVTLDLGAGVTASVPTALWTDGGNTLPRQPAAVQPNPRSTTAADRATRIADVVIAWNIFQHFYPYFDVVPVNWPAVLRDYLPQAATSDENRFLQVLQQFVATLQDGHGGVNGGGAPGAFLPFAWEWIQDSLVVTHADGQEIQRGDVVTMVDGRPAAMAIADKERMVSSATPQWRRYRALMELTMGPLNSEVVLQVRTGDGPSREVRVRRAGRLVREPKPEVVQELRPGVFYVDIDRTTTEQWQKALPSLAAASAVIFDLRGYPRATPVFIQHIITTPVQSARWQVPVATRPDRQGVTYLESGRWNLQPLTPQIKGKLAFVTDGRAISYAESCLGIIEHYKLAEIVGGPTAGTNGNVNPFQLPGGYSVAWTGMRVLKHDGSRHHGVGILPTIPASRTIAGVAAGRDELLERAIEAVTR
jgi:C-terminal processing protease CtpA/Prc